MDRDRDGCGLGTGRQGPVTWGETIIMPDGWSGGSQGGYGQGILEEDWSPVGEGLRTWSPRRTASGKSS